MSVSPVEIKNSYLLYIFSEKRLLNLKIYQNEFISYGKNWFPININEKLHLCSSIDPLVILKPNLINGNCEIVDSFKTSFNILTHHDKYTSFRGGTNGFLSNKYYFGLGHFTSKRYIHMPFLWQYNSVIKEVNFSFLNIFKLLNNIGFYIVDPVNIFEDSFGNKYISLDCSVRDWFYDQEFMQLIIPIKDTEKKEYLISNKNLNSFIRRFKTKSTKLLIGDDFNFYHDSHLDKYDHLFLNHELEDYQLICSGYYYDILSYHLKVEISFEFEKYDEEFPIFIEIRLAGEGASHILVKKPLEIEKSRNTHINLFNTLIPKLIDYRLQISIEIHRSASIKLNHMRLFWMEENAKEDLNKSELIDLVNSLKTSLETISLNINNLSLKYEKINNRIKEIEKNLNS